MTKPNSTNERQKRRRSALTTHSDLHDLYLDDAIILADMRERVRLFDTTPLRFA
jgi:hypothetical protein